MGRTVMTLTGADAGFDRLVDAILRRLRLAMRLPSPTENDPDVEREIARLREQLTGFRPEYEAIQARLIEKYVGVDRLADVIALLQTDGMRHYFQALSEMNGELSAEVLALGQRMGDVTIGAS